MPHVRCDIEVRVHICQRLVSIHEPRAGRNECIFIGQVSSYGFNPRAPCGAQHLPSQLYGNIYLFQSTRPMRGATRCAASCKSASTSFNPRAPCGARHFDLIDVLYPSGFNPRAPCGARPHRHPRCSASPSFQSTRPMRGATTCSSISV